MTSQRQISLFTEEELTSLQVDSPVNPIHPQESDSARRMRDTSGRRCLEQFERFSRPGLWAKTFAGLLIGTEGWFSMKCRLNWKLKATKSHRFYFQLVPSTLPIEETEFGLLPTPLAQAREQTNFDAYDQRMERLIEKGHKPFTMPLDQMALRGLLPTPNSRDYKDAQTPEKYQERKELWAEKGVNLQLSLPQLIKNQMIPTPTASDRFGSGSREALINRGRGEKNDLGSWATMNSIDGKNSQLSPQFVMEMMGFPIDWTLLPFLNGDKNQSKQEEMQ